MHALLLNRCLHGRQAACGPRARCRPRRATATNRQNTATNRQNPCLKNGAESRGAIWRGHLARLLRHMRLLAAVAHDVYVPLLVACSHHVGRISRSGHRLGRMICLSFARRPAAGVKAREENNRLRHLSWLTGSSRNVRRQHTWPGCAANYNHKSRRILAARTEPCDLKSKDCGAACADMACHARPSEI